MALALSPLLTENCLFIDGPARVGKMMIAAAVSNLEGIEYINVQPDIENLGMLARLGVLSDDDAAAAIRTNINHHSYERIIGRHLNNRPSDRLGLSRALKAPTIEARSKAEDTAMAVKDYRRAGTVPSFFTHDSIPNIEIFLKAHPGLSFIHVTRHPVDAAMSFYLRGWGDRHGTDPLNVSAAVKTSYGPVPWWAVDWEEEYHKLTPFVRALRGMLVVYEHYEQKIAASPPMVRKRILTVRYENFLTKTKDELHRVATFLETSVPSEIDVVLKKLSLPNTFDNAGHHQKKERLLSEAPPELAEQLQHLISRYEKG